VEKLKDKINKEVRTFRNMAVRADSVLSIETGLVFKSGEVVPVARTRFFLTFKNIADILREIDQATDTTDSIELGVFNMMLDLGLTEKGKADREEKINLINMCEVVSSITDFGGKAVFPPVAPGIYYLVGWTKIRNTRVLWHVKMNLKPGSNTIILDQNNGIVNE
jgi:hypothetical protein